MFPINLLSTIKHVLLFSRIRKFAFLILGGMFLGTTCLADEGMWLPLYLKIINEQAMQDLGMKLTTDQIYSINKASMKDAVVQFGGGCTGEIISPEGLVLTNHHCGFSYVQQHSTVQNDLLTNGFWAADHASEKPNPGLSVSILVRMEEVTQRVTEGIPPGATEREKELVIAKNIEKIKKEAISGTHYTAFVRPFYYGAEYYLFVNEVFKDIRLVGAPPTSIGAFGGDADNWSWPRHTGDFSLFRIYAGPDNKPAAYSPSNLPYRPKQHFHISLDGVKENDFTLVLGYPGRTQEYLTAYAVRIIEKESNAFKIALRDKRMKLMAEAMATSDSLRIKYAARYASIANYHKKWAGENKGLDRLSAAEKKEEQEAAFTAWVSADPKRQKEYGKVLPTLKGAYDTLSRIILPVEYRSEAVYGNEILPFVSSFGAINELILAGKAESKAYEALQNQITGFFNGWYMPLDKKMFTLCMKSVYTDVRPEYRSTVLTEFALRSKGNFEMLTEELFKKSAFTDRKRTQKLFAQLQKGNNEKLNSDPLFMLWADFNQNYEKRLQPVYTGLRNTIEAESKLYVEGLRKMYPDKNFYPDANFTFRVAYGKVSGYQPLDGETYKWQTTLNGVMEKEDSSIDEFKVPVKLKELFRRRDYGIYGQAGKMPLAFTASNHTTGGNSGSPVIDAYGRLIGTNFDRCWEGTMSDIMYDPLMCRNISLDIRYTLFVIDKFAGAGHLVQEMTLEKAGKIFYYKP